MNTVWKHRFLAPACASFLVLAVTSPLQAGAPPQADTSAKQTPEEQAKLLAAQMVQTISSMPGNSTARQYEAQLAFVLDQSRAPCATLVNALTSVSGESFTPTIMAALSSLKATVSRCRTGTGAGPDGSDGNGSAPVTNFSLSGGSSYTL